MSVTGAPVRADVLVVGAGPVGLTLAAELARFGVAVRIIDKAVERSSHSKALVVWSRSLELIDRMGCGPAFLTAGLKVTAANINAGRRRIGHVPLAALDTPHPYALMLPQNETERLLQEHLGHCGGAIERQVELTSFETVTGGVLATLRHRDGAEQRIEAAWLVGCDGAHSTVRHALGSSFEGNTLPSHWMLADVMLDRPGGGDPSIEMFWHREGALALFPIAGRRWRVIADIPAPSNAATVIEPTLAQIQAVLDRRGPGGIAASAPIWLSGFRINERKVADYRSGPVFLAGDAAHVHSPAGGQGMNTGMQDAFNLAWKLALVCRGLAAPELLDSYSAERSAVGRQVLANAGRLTAAAVLRNGALQALRNTAAAALLALPPVRRVMARTLAELTIGYSASAPTLRQATGAGGPAPGARVPPRADEAPIGSGDTPRFALFAPQGPAAAAILAQYAAAMEPRPRTPLAPGSFHLVRPDGYVARAWPGSRPIPLAELLPLLSLQTPPDA